MQASNTVPMLHRMPVLMLMLMALTGFAASPTEAVCQEFSVTNGLCSVDEALSVATEAASPIECALKCSKTSGCFACHRDTSFATNKWQLLHNVSVNLTPGSCKLITKMDTPEESCTANMTLDAPFLALNASDYPKNLAELLCSHWCRQLASDGSLFAPLGAKTSAPEPGAPVRCEPLTVSAYFAKAAAVADFSPLAVSVRWRLDFSSETWCTHTAAGNVPPVIHLAWSLPHHLDVCAQACASRPTYEFFLFNASGCFEGSLSLYLNSRLQGVQGCSMWHKARSWAPSMLAFYTFNSSMLNLANPAVMPAVNNSPIDIGPDGIQIPLSTSQFVRLNLSHIGFDSLVRSNTPLTFVVSFNRETLKDRSELAMFASCSNNNEHNGAINERPFKNEGWFLNSLTGEWLIAESVAEGSTYTYPSSSTIHMAMALGPTSGYFVVNGVKLDTRFYTQTSTYGTDPVEIGCLYLGFNFAHAPRNFLYGRIKVFGIFSEFLTVEQIKELV